MRRSSAALPAAVLVAFVGSFQLAPRADRDPFAATFSIVGYDEATGDLGVAVQSKFPNVRAVVPWAKAGVGAVATQSFAELDYGIRGLELLERGATAAITGQVAPTAAVEPGHRRGSGRCSGEPPPTPGPTSVARRTAVRRRRSPGSADPLCVASEPCDGPI